MKQVILPLTLGLGLLLSGCAAPVAARPASVPSTPIGAVPRATVPSSPTEAPPGGVDPFGPTARPPELQALARVDQQGTVTVEVIPTNLHSATESIDFEVAMNTHSVNLSMDLARLSTLTTDTGLTVAAEAWNAPPGGGHHVRGCLVFPATKDGKPILEGATKLTLTIRDVDASARTFEWQLP